MSILGGGDTNACIGRVLDSGERAGVVLPLVGADEALTRGYVVEPVGSHLG